MAGKTKKKATDLARRAGPADARASTDDSAARESIVNKLDVCMLVEAAAGTGKTKGMVDRMVALIAEGVCGPEQIAAVTFTRKAAAELRSRFEAAVEEAVRREAGVRRERLARAREGAGCGFIGTIHSFCARILRERPVEAGVEIGFRELEDAEDMALREEAWTEFLAHVYDAGSRAVGELDELGVELGSLRAAFRTFSDYPDVEDWPAEAASPLDVSGAAEALRGYLAEVEGLLSGLPENPGNDGLIPAMRQVHRMAGHSDLGSVAELMEVMEVFLKEPKIVRKEWPGGKAQAEEELDRWTTFARSVARPFADAVRERRYAVAMKALAEARSFYDRLRRERGALSYQDLLMKAAALLRDEPEVRRYFADRFRRILVDEFQDTDPLQAEVILLLAADDPRERDWRRARPRPGAFFAVGDPKQSIYRFRRADISTYMRVARIVEESGGLIVRLSKSFRASGALVSWVNGVFRGQFPDDASEIAPAYVELISAGGARKDAAAVKVIRIPEEYGDKLSAAEYEARVIAGAIREGIASGRSPGEFMIVTFYGRQLGVYARALESLGIPHRVTGGTALNDVEELGLLYLCLEAANAPEDGVALVAALRSAAFGVSDEQLWEFSRAGGRFSLLEPLPGGLRPETAAAFERAFSALKRCARILSEMPPAAASRVAAEELGLLERAASGPGGDFRAGSLLKAIELLRASGASGPAEAVEYLRRLVTASEDADRHDGEPALGEGTDVVRVMNLHKAKGLEADVVFLADASGESSHGVSFHVDRSGEKVLGYLALYGERRGQARAPLLACPHGWEELAAREQSFLDAERVRLFYVAATRARSELVIVQREKGNHFNPWRFFEGHLQGCQELMALPEEEGPSDGERPSTSARPEAPVSEREAEAVCAEAASAAEAIRARWLAAVAPSYEVRAAKAVFVGPPRSAEDERVLEFAEAVHRLLELAAREGQVDLRKEADRLGLRGAEAEEAVECAGAVVRSELWKRSRRAARRLVEAPFAIERAEAAPAGVVRGRLDLAFLEDDGWVVVDYKTDRVTREGALRAAGKYMPQVRLYAEALARQVREPVKEIGLYFARAGVYLSELVG